jgi:hypothetical protein
MALRERLIYAVEFVTDQAKSGIGGIKSSIADADGVVNKFKAGAGSAFASVGANAGMMAAAAGGAVAAFAFKAVNAFTDTAKAAIDLGHATGMSTEESSRWIALADDFEVTAETLTSGLGKIGKTLDSEKWQKYGIATRDAGGNARSTNDILLDTFDMLGKVSNETERTRIGTDLLGKGYAGLSPLVGKSRAEYEELLATQQKGQVITEAEAAKAEKARLAMDNLHDTLNEVTLEIGQRLAPALADLANNIAAVVDVADGLKIFDALELGMKASALNIATEGWKKFKGVFGGSDGVNETLSLASTKSQDLIADSIAAAEAGIEHAESMEAQKRQGDAYVDSLIAQGEANKAAADRASDKAHAEDDAAEQTEKHRRAADQMTDALNRERSATLQLVGGEIAIRDAKNQAHIKYQEYLVAVRDGTIAKGQEQAAIDEVTSGYLNEARAIAENRIKQMEATGQTVDAAVQQQVMRDALTQTAAHLDGPFRAALQFEIDLLNEFERPRQANLSAVITTSTGLLVSANPLLSAARVGQRIVGARGAVINRRVDGITAGEDGPEALIPLDELDGTTPLDHLGGGGVREVHVHIHAGTLIHESQLGQLANRALTTFKKNGGRLGFVNGSTG